MKKIIAVLSIGLSLTACVPGVFIAGAATGGMAVYDRRNIKLVMQDNEIHNGITQEIKKDPAFAHSHVVVSSFHHSVLLVGQTPLASLRVRAEKIAREQRGVAKIYNEITIASPTSSITRSSDTWITTKVKTHMVALKELKASDIKVVTENGTVFLVGKTSRKQADMAVNVARTIDGVQRIVKAFIYTD